MLSIFPVIDWLAIPKTYCVNPVDNIVRVDDVLNEIDTRLEYVEETANVIVVDNPKADIKVFISVKSVVIFV